MSLFFYQSIFQEKHSDYQFFSHVSSSRRSYCLVRTQSFDLNHTTPSNLHKSPLASCFPLLMMMMMTSWLTPAVNCHVVDDTEQKDLQEEKRNKRQRGDLRVLLERTRSDGVRIEWDRGKWRPPKTEQLKEEKQKRSWSVVWIPLASPNKLKGGGIKITQVLNVDFFIYI